MNARTRLPGPRGVAQVRPLRRIFRDPSAALDELLGMAQSLSDKSGMTGTLTVRYRRPTPLHKELSFTAWVDRVEGRKIFTTGTIHDGETLCAEAEGVFISVDFAAMQAMQARERGRTDTSAPQ